MELSLKNQEPNKVPQEIQNLLGKSYTFQIKVDDYNVKEGWEVYTVTSVFKSESNKHSENIVADNIQIKPSETLFSHHQPIANNPIAASDIKLLTSLKDVTDDNLIDEVFEKTQLKFKHLCTTNNESEKSILSLLCRKILQKKRTSKQTSNNNTGSSQNKKKK
nr:hypothetical protein CFP56_55851 [Quercus suber]